METNDSYTSKVDAGEWPADCAVPLDDPFVNEAGTIQNLVLKPVGGMAVIRSKAGSLRSNHYHKTDWHYIYVVSGRLLYYEREVGSDRKPEPQEFGPDEMFFTPPMMEHCVAFLEDTVIVTGSRNPRFHEGHEADLVRVHFVTPEDVEWA
jgi:dTDP-4-dehydrorhamnose 3,5-epimerase-like enzyme